MLIFFSLIYLSNSFLKKLAYHFDHFLKLDKKITNMKDL